MLKKLKKHFLIATVLFFIAHAQVPATTYVDTTTEDLVSQACQTLGVTSKNVKTQTLAYLGWADLRSNLNIYGDKIKEIGTGYFKKFFKYILKNELDFNNNYRVFYHAQMREFALFQDLYEGLYKIAYKKALRDFALLRVPHKFYSKFKNINDFLHFYIKNGQIKDKHFNYISSDVQKRLLSVNPSLFGNANKFHESSFYYFLYAMSWQPIDIIYIIQDLFDMFNYGHYFSKYKTEIQELNTILSASEEGKTGILLQIFVPEKLVNSLAYCCKICGCLYHTDEKPENHPATTDLDNYKNKSSYGQSSKVFDEIQYRLLIDKTMLDPNSGIKFFRYCNQTNNMKKYTAKLKKLLHKIATDVQAQT